MIRITTIASVVWLEMLRKKEFYVLLILLAILLTTLLALNVFGLGGMTVYIKDAGLLLGWILGWILAVNLSCRQLPREERQGTIFPLLSKPISRGELIVGKWLGAWTAVSFAIACFYVMIWLVVWLKGGEFGRRGLAQGYLLHITALGVVAALGLALSTRLNNDAAATLAYVLSGACYAVLPRLPALLISTFDWRGDCLMALYYALPHFELFDLRRRIIHDWGPMDPGVFVQILLYGMLFVVVFLLLAWLSYRHKRFTRGEML